MVVWGGRAEVQVSFPTVGLTVGGQDGAAMKEKVHDTGKQRLLLVQPNRSGVDSSQVHEGSRGASTSLCRFKVKVIVLVSPPFKDGV